MGVRLARPHPQSENEATKSAIGRLVEGTRAAYGTQTPEAERRTDVTILDVLGNAAAVKIDAGGWIDYLQMSRMDGRWVIVNVLWERRQ